MKYSFGKLSCLTIVKRHKCNSIHDIKNPTKQTKNVCNIKDFSNNQNKTFINTMFSNYVVNTLYSTSLKNIFVGALDSVERNTSIALQNVGVPKNNILLIEREHHIYKSHKNAGYNAIQVSKDGLTDYANQRYVNMSTSFEWNNTRCVGWYFDMCGSITTQQHGILSTITKLNLIDNAILGFTFCKRTHGKPYESSKNDFLTELKKCLLKKKFKHETIVDRDYNGKQFFKESSTDTKKHASMNSFIIKITQISMCIA